MVKMAAANFGFIYESALSAASAASHPKLILISSEESDDIVGELANRGKDLGSAIGRRLPIRLVNDRGGLWFWRRLSYADIQVSTAIQIGARDADFVLGPDVNIEAISIGCDSPTIRVYAPTQEMAVLITAETYRGDTVEFLGTHDERKHLGVNWIPRQYPWAQYARPVEPEIPVSTEMKEAFRKLRRVLVCFRAEGYGEMARHEDLLHNVVIAGAGAGRLILNYCVKQKLIRTEGPMYILDRDGLNRLGINWADIRERRLSQSIARFLRDFVQPV